MNQYKLDSLSIPARIFYQGFEYYNDRAELRGALDDAGKELLQMACQREHIAEAKKRAYMRRVHTESYISRSEDGEKMYLNSFDQLGARWIKPFHEIIKSNHTGWYTDDFGGAYNGAVLCFTRHGEGDGIHPNEVGPAKGRIIYMAGIRHSDWGGVTLDLAITEDINQATRWADSMAEREAEICYEENEKDQAEQEEAERLEAAIEEEHAI